ncbi:MAG: phosphate ABC transporter substrate-binding protein [Kiritimatiellaeota bacterium]|nr:phosphate ABC transporter substrate-binding protein [Kiritimatiellota bacterium]
MQKSISGIRAKMLTRLALVGCAVAVALCGCGRKSASITLAGSTAFQPFAEKLAEQYMAAHPEVGVTVQGGGSAVGIQSALSGAAQIGMADLLELPPEAQGLTSVIVARDGIALVVHPANPVTNLALAQAREIFAGTLSNWKDAGGADQPITVVSREAGSGTRSSFEKLIGVSKLSPDAIVQDSSGTIRETVINDQRAIGYLSHGLVNDKIKMLKVDDQECSTDKVIAGKYPLVRPIFLLTKGAPEGLAQAFIAYILSAEGQQCIHKNGLIPAK